MNAIPFVNQFSNKEIHWSQQQKTTSLNNRKIRERFYLNKLGKERFDLKKDEYNQIISECSVADWNGYNALPLDSVSIQYCIKFINLLPETVSLPDLCPEPDGILGMEWHKNDYFISVGINKDSILTWGGITPFGNVHGNETFINAIPQKMLNLLKQIKG